MARSLEQMWEDLAYVHEAGDYELGKTIYNRIKEEEELEDTGYFEGRAAGFAAGAQESAAGIVESVAELGPKISAMRKGGFAEEGESVSELDGGVRAGFDPVIDDTWRARARENRKKQQYSTPDNAVLAFGTEAVDALVTMAPSIVASVATGGTAAPLALMALPAFGHGYDKQRQRMEEEGGEIDVGRATFEGMVQVGMEVGPEKLFGVFDKFGVGTNLKKAFASVMAKEAGSEVATEEMNILYDALVHGEFRGSFGDILGSIAHAAGIGAVLGGGIAGPRLPAQARDNKAREEIEKRLEEIANMKVVDPTTMPELDTGPVSIGTEAELTEGARELRASEFAFPTIEADKEAFRENLDRERAAPAIAAEAASREAQANARSDFEANYDDLDLGGQAPQPINYEQADPAIVEEPVTVDVDPAQMELDQFKMEEFASVAGQERNLTDEEFDTIRNLELNRDFAEESAEAVDALVPDYMRSGKGKWRLIAIEPVQGRMHARWTSKNEEFEVNWLIGRPETMVATVDATGKEVRKGEGAKQPNMPKKLREKFDQLAELGVLSDGIVAKGGGRRYVEKGGPAKVDFRGAFPLDIAVRKAGEQAVQSLHDETSKYQPVTREEELKAREEAETEARTIQDERAKFVSRRLAEGGSRATIIKTMPQHELDRGHRVVTITNLESTNRLKRSETASERAVQVLPDGTLRSVEIRLNEKGNKYEAYAVSQGLNPYKQEELLGEMVYPVDTSKIAKERREARSLTVEEAERKAKAALAKQRKNAKATYDNLTASRRKSKFADVDYTEENERIDRGAEATAERERAREVKRSVRQREERVEKKAAEADVEKALALPAVTPAEEETGGIQPVEEAELEASLEEQARRDERRKADVDAFAEDLIASSEKFSEQTEGKEILPGKDGKDAQLSLEQASAKVKADIQKVVEKLYPFAIEHIAVFEDTLAGQSLRPGKSTIAKAETGGKAVINQRAQMVLDKVSQVLYAGRKYGVWSSEDIQSSNLLEVLQYLVERDTVIAATNKEDVALDDETIPEFKLVRPGDQIPISVIKETYMAIMPEGQQAAQAEAKRIAAFLKYYDETVPLALRGEVDKLVSWYHSVESTRQRQHPRAKAPTIEASLEKALKRLQPKIDAERDAQSAEELLLEQEIKKDESEDIRARLNRTVEDTERRERYVSEVGRLRAKDEGVGTAETRRAKKERAEALDEAAPRLADTLEKQRAREERAGSIQRISDVLGEGVATQVQRKLDDGASIEEVDKQLKQAIAQMESLEDKKGTETDIERELRRSEIRRSATAALVDMQPSVTVPPVKEIGPTADQRSQDAEADRLAKLEDAAQVGPQVQLGLQLEVPPEVAVAPEPGEVPTLSDIRKQQKALKKERTKAKAAATRAAKKEAEKRFRALSMSRAFGQEIAYIDNHGFSSFDAGIQTGEAALKAAETSVSAQPEAAWTNKQIERMITQEIVDTIKASTNAQDATVDPETGEVVSSSYEIGSEDDGNYSAYVARGKAYDFRAKWMTRITSGLWRGSGLKGKYGQKLVNALWTPNRGAAQAAQNRVDKDYLRAVAEMRKEGFDVHSKPGMGAIIDYLQGMSPNSIRVKHGVTIPEPAVPFLNSIADEIRANSLLGKEAGAYAEGNVLAAIKTGRPYLHRTVDSKRLKKLKLTDQQRDVLIMAMKPAYNIPSTREEAARMGPKKLARMIRDYGVFSDKLSKLDSIETPDGIVDVTSFVNPTNGKRVNFAKRTKSGTLMLDKGLLANEADMTDFILGNQPNEEQWQQMVWDIIGGYTGTTVSGKSTTRGEGADAQSRRARDLLFSDMELIGKAIKSFSKGQTKTLQAALADNHDRYATMGVEEFLQEIQRDFPALVTTAEDVKFDLRYKRALRDVIMEVNDPGTVLSDTIQRLAGNVYMSKYLGQLAKTGLRSGWMSKNSEAETLVQLAPETTALGQTTFRDDTGEIVQASNIYVSPEVRQELQEMTGWGRERPGVLMKWIYGASGWSKYGLVVLNPLAHSRNFVSTSFIHALRGGALDPRAIGWAGKSAAGQLRAATTRGQAVSRVANQDKFISNLEDLAIENGILFDGGRSGAIKDIFVHMQKTGQSAEELMGSIGKVHGFADAGASKAKAAPKAIGRLANEAFRLEDEWVKIASFSTDARAWLRWHTGSDAVFMKAMNGEKLTTEESKNMKLAAHSAAESTLDRYPTFSRAAPWIQKISRTPIVGAFPTFSYEMIRTTVNHWKYLAKMYNGRTYDGKKVEDPAVRTAMAGRATAMLANEIAGHAAIATIGAGITQMAAEAMTKYFSDDDPDEDISFLADAMNAAIGRSENEDRYGGLVPSYLRNTHAYVTNVDKIAGTWTVNDFSYLSPYGGISSALMEYGEEIYEAFANNDPKKADAIIGGAVDAFFDVFLHDEVLLGGASERFAKDASSVMDYEGEFHMTRLGNFAERAVRGINEESAAVQGAGSLLGSVFEANPLREGYRLGKNVYDYSVELYDGEHGEGSAAWGDVLKTAGNKMVGFKRIKHEFREDFPKNASMDLKRLRETNTSMLRRLSTTNAETYEEFADEYRHYSSARRQAFKLVHKGIKDAAVGLGRDRWDIDQALADAKLTTSASGIPKENFYTGEYLPIDTAKFRAQVEKYLPGGDNDHITTLEYDRVDQLNEWYTRARYDLQENIY